MNKPLVIVSGGAGFLGSHLSDKLLQKGYSVIALDNLSTGSRHNVEHLRDNPSFTLIEHDICDPLPYEVTVADVKIIANLASPASPPHYQRLAIETLEVGSRGLQNMLELARTSGARFFHSSTSEVYGDPKVHPQPETYWGHVNSYGPRSMYDESKRFAEALIYAYRQKYSVNTGIVRIFNTYGPRMDPEDGRVVSNFIVQALKGKPLTLYGDGSQTRSFCYVDDLIDGFMKMIESSEEGPMNLGNPSEFTIKELADVIKEMVPTAGPVIHKPMPADDPTQRKPVIKRAQEQLHWEPKIDLRTGLGKTIAYFKDSLGA